MSERVACPFCSQKVALTKSRRIRAHHTIDWDKRRARRQEVGCPGGGLDLDEARESAAMSDEEHKAWAIKQWRS